MPLALPVRSSSSRRSASTSPQPFNVFLNTGVEGGNQTLRKLHPISRRKSHGVSRNFFKGCMHNLPLLTMM